MSLLSQTLENLDAEIKNFQEAKAAAISHAPATFEHVEDKRFWSNDRYFILRADGVPMSLMGNKQRPAAESRFKYMSQQFNNNVYFFDRREGTVTDFAGNIVHHVAPLAV